MLHPGRKFLLLSWLLLSLLSLSRVRACRLGAANHGGRPRTVEILNRRCAAGSHDRLRTLITAAEYTAVSDAAGGYLISLLPVHINNMKAVARAD